MPSTLRLLLTTLTTFTFCVPLSAQEKKRPNVLFLIADDLAATIHCFGDSRAKTPNIDALAKRAVAFQRAYCQFPHCNPSRASIFSGLRPGVTKVTNNGDDLYKNIPGVVTLPALFRMHGYLTLRCGKIFHLGVPTGTESKDDPAAWDRGLPFKDERPYPMNRKSEVDVGAGKGKGLGWTETLGGDDLMVDGQFAKTAIDWLKERDKSKPFFLAVGFHRPHVPLVAPGKYFDLYPFADIRVLEEPKEHFEKIPIPARNGSVPGYTLTATPEQRRAAIRAYLACVSYVDAQVGRLMETLKELGLDENTIIVFTSDHGWHLGEHGLWHKRSLFEESARVPLLVRVPGGKHHGQSSRGLVELLDLYPTLCDLTGVPAPKILQGKSLRPVLEDPAKSIHDGAFTEAKRGPKAEFRGRSIRTDRWRCTEWDEGVNGLELYDHDADPRELVNLADDPRHAEMLRILRERLKKVATGE